MNPVAWNFLGELPAGVPGRFAVVCPDAGVRQFDCDLLAAMCAAFLGTFVRSLRHE
jgi:hypothetical protein